MKAVNQSIGRAIRHANDYASIVLVDHRYTNVSPCNRYCVHVCVYCRYCSSSIYSKLPKWISSELVISSSFGHMFGAVRKVHKYVCVSYILFIMLYYSFTQQKDESTTSGLLHAQ